MRWEEGGLSAGAPTHIAFSGTVREAKRVETRCTADSCFRLYSQRQMASDATEEQLSADRVVPLCVGLLINCIIQPAWVERALQRVSKEE